MKVALPWQPAYTSSRRAENHRLMWTRNGGPTLLKDILLHGPESVVERGKGTFHPVNDMFNGRGLAGIDALSMPRGWSHIQIPGNGLF